MEVGLGPRRIVLDGDLDPLREKGDRARTKFPAHFYYGQTAGYIKKPPVMDVGFSPSYFALDGDPAPPPQKGSGPPIFGPCLLWSNGWMDQDATWYGCRPRPRRHCVTWGPSSPQRAQPPIFGPCLLWPNGSMYQGTTWQEGGPQPRGHCVR